MCEGVTFCTSIGLWRKLVLCLNSFIKTWALVELLECRLWKVETGNCAEFNYAPISSIKSRLWLQKLRDHSRDIQRSGQIQSWESYFSSHCSFEVGFLFLSNTFLTPMQCGHTYAKHTSTRNGTCHLFPLPSTEAQLADNHNGALKLPPGNHSSPRVLLRSGDRQK